jgi:hypothetical protein
MYVATCFDSKESSSGYYMNHNIDIYQMAVHIWEQPKGLHKWMQLQLQFTFRGTICKFT